MSESKPLSAEELTRAIDGLEAMVVDYVRRLARGWEMRGGVSDIYVRSYIRDALAELNALREMKAIESINRPVITKSFTKSSAP